MHEFLKPSLTHVVAETPGKLDRPADHVTGQSLTSSWGVDRQHLDIGHALNTQHYTSPSGRRLSLFCCRRKPLCPCSELRVISRLLERTSGQYKKQRPDNRLEDTFSNDVCNLWRRSVYLWSLEDSVQHDGQRSLGHSVHGHQRQVVIPHQTVNHCVRVGDWVDSLKGLIENIWPQNCLLGCSIYIFGSDLTKFEITCHRLVQMEALIHQTVDLSKLVWT